jgi:5-methylcytosine-specific restriction endonuclease McrA
MAYGMTCPLMPYAHAAGRCDHCGHVLHGRQTRYCGARCRNFITMQHRWTQARAAAKKRDGYACTECGDDKSLEVHHVIPREGNGYGWGCAHHSENLLTLCHTHHVVINNQQAAMRRAIKESA